MNNSRDSPSYRPPYRPEIVPEDDKSSDYEEINDDPTSTFEIDRCQVNLGDILGAGQFGDVFRGTFYHQGEKIPVAIKTCKLEKEEEMAEKLLQEAGIMEQFDHKHIIRFYGVCSSEPVWIIMELAAMGEMRKFLKDNTDSLSVDRLVLYCYQLSTALQYLESKHFVHRDIAARNVLVSSWSCVKLADFGLSRWLSDNNYYKASKAMKLPIKWMAPESINFRRFTTMSDVWMFAVCMWEIMTYGDKPFPGVSNNEVIRLLENDVRLSLPPGCPPSLYLVMCNSWQLEPNSRPRFSEIEARIRRIHLDEQHMQNQDVRLGFKRKQNRGSSVDADTPPEKPSRSLSRRHSGFVGRSNPELDESSRSHHLDLDRYRVSTWKSDHDVTDLVDGGNPSSAERLRTNDHYRSPVRDAATPTVRSNHVTDYKKLSPPTLEDKLRQQQIQSQMDSSWLKVLEENHARRPQCGTRALFRRPGEETETKKKEDDHEWEVRLGDIVLDRTNDYVHKATLNVVTAVAEMIKTLDNSTHSCNQLANLYLPMVKKIGDMLKTFITVVDEFLSTLPRGSKDPVILATKMLNSDMAGLIHQMKLAQQYSTTVLDKEYLKKMLQAGHALAVDCKNLLEAVDIARKKQIYLQRQEKQSSEAVTHQRPQRQATETAVLCSGISAPASQYSSNIH